jgi:hypothetical protein
MEVFMRKALVKLDLSGLTVPEKIEKAKVIVSKMTGNGSFTTPSPTLAAVTTAIVDLETAYDNALGGGVALTAIKDEKEAVLDSLLMQLAAYVQSKSNFSETVILSSGMGVRNAPAPVGIPSQVMGLVALFSLIIGTIRLRWKKVRGAYVYHVFMTDDIGKPETFKLIGTSTSTRFVITGLDSGKRYWFRSEAVGAAGTGAVSDSASMLSA